jgi:Putative metal-binding motif/Calx-beta domain
MTTGLNATATSNSITILAPSTPTVWYKDTDNDGYGDGTTQSSCTQPAGYKAATQLTATSGDCNDNDDSIYPGAKEICGNGIDDNCNGQVDEGCTAYIFYEDADDDFYGNGVVYVINYTGIPPAGYVSDRTDCNDRNPRVHPRATEECNGIDDNCNGVIDEGCTLFTFYKDADGDTYGNPALPVTNYTGIAPAGYVTNKTDCNDANGAVNPGAAEICGNGIDDNCNGVIDEGCTSNTTATICDASITEGNCGTKLLCFTVTLSKAATIASSVKYKTSNGTAVSTSDYKAADATLNFAAGQSVKNVCIIINGDYTVEANETFFVTLYSPVNLQLGSKVKATGTIINDDKACSKPVTLPVKLSTEVSMLTVPTLLHRGQQWAINNLPSVNRVTLYNTSGIRVFDAVNYSNNLTLPNAAAGMYYYQIITTGKEERQEIFKGKMVVTD